VQLKYVVAGSIVVENFLDMLFSIVITNMISKHAIQKTWKHVFLARPVLLCPFLALPILLMVHFEVTFVHEFHKNNLFAFFSNILIYKKDFPSFFHLNSQRFFVYF